MTLIHTKDITEEIRYMTGKERTKTQIHNKKSEL